MRRNLLLCGLVLVSSYAWCDQVRFGDWVVDTSLSGYQIASTTNDDGSSAGVICNLETESCEAYVVPDASCVSGESYPLMINSSVGAFPAIPKCVHIDTLHILVADNFQNMMNAFESGGEIGFAVPMQSGKFQVSRFSTAGAVAAISRARTPVTPRPSNRAVRSRRGNESL